MTYQYVTTTGRYGGGHGVSNPVAPADVLTSNRGILTWELIGCCAADGLLFWFWRAPK